MPTSRMPAPTSGRQGRLISQEQQVSHGRVFQIHPKTLLVVAVVAVSGDHVRAWGGLSKVVPCGGDLKRNYIA